MDLIPQLNETALQTEAEEFVFEENCKVVAKQAGVTAVELAESVVEWLMSIAQQVEQGTLSQPEADNTAAMADHADKMRGTAEVLGAIEALTNPDLAAASNIKNPGAILKIAHSDHAQSDQAVDKLKEFGRGDARGQTNQMAKLLQSGDNEAIMQMLKKMKYKAQTIARPEQDQPEQQQQQPGSLGLKGAMQKQPEI